MAEKMSQKGRVLEISTPLGDDFLLPWKMTSKEEISGLFSIEMELLHQESNKNPHKTTIIEPDSILGKPVTISVSLTGGKERRLISGIVNRFSQGGRSVVFSHYHATIVPHIWVLTQNFQSRIFQDMKVPDILLKVFEGFAVIPEMRGDHKPRNYVVQYRESDFDFASRLMEEEGIYCYFLHEDGMDKLVLADTPDSHRDTPVQTDFTYYHTELDSKADQHHIKRWQTDHALGSGKLTLWDHHFEKPQDNFSIEQPSRYGAGGKHEMEVYDFPGGYAKRFDGIDKGGKEQPNELVNIYDERKKDAEIRMTAFDSHFEISHGESRCVPFIPGHKFKLKGHPNKELNKGFMLLSVDFAATQFPAYLSDMETADEPYENTFSCIPLGAGAPHFRPLRKTSKPIVHGMQTATVVGRPGDEEIFTDKYGRIKVMFHWDREQKNDPSSSAWLRVAKDLAGNKWGTMYIPRVGQEVLVAFLHGDPDQPVAVGSAYNAETMPHYELPKFKTLTYIKTRTTPDDGKGYNELRFEDKANKEQVFVRSQKRMDVRVRGSLYETCGGSRNEVIGLKQENQPGGNLAVTVAGCYDLHVKESNYIGIDADLNETVKGNVAEDYQGNHSTQVKSKRELNAQEITLEAMSKITLKVGGSFVSIDLSGVTISGPMVKINSGGAGMGTTPAEMMEPVDAETSDTGEPGYLEKPRKGGGGGGRKKKTINGRHAPPFATKTLPNGDIQVGNGIVIKKSPTDPNFQQKALDDLTTMSNYPAGMDTLNGINNSGKTTNIQHKPAGGNNYTPSDVAGALPKGDKFGGTTGTGTGSGGTVGWNPDNAATNAKRPRDVGLHHELSHADHASNGQYDITHNDPSQPKNPHKEESNTIDQDNEYRKQRGVHTRKDHTEL
jgi:type VI secretion system secreted protein VgrG